MVREWKMMFLKKICLIFILVMAFSSSLHAAPEAYRDFIGTWRRMDADYVICIRDIAATGKASVSYYNPGNINVSEARVSGEKEGAKVFIKLQDEGYPGSHYTLYYYPDNDLLGGYYYHATLKQKFKVIFQRMKAGCPGEAAGT